MNIVWLVESFGREAKAAVTFGYDPFTSPLIDTDTANCGGTVPLSGCALIDAVVVEPVPVGVAGDPVDEVAFTVKGAGKFQAVWSMKDVSPIQLDKE